MLERNVETVKRKDGQGPCAAEVRKTQRSAERIKMKNHQIINNPENETQTLEIEWVKRK